jgi:uncharacterized ferritin-like protein (DUF455 family)
MQSEVLTVRDFCLRLLQSGDLATKLAPACRLDGSALSDENPGPAVFVTLPARAPGLEMDSGAGALPRPRELRSPEARAHCLARFAHHELMAAELFAWALLRWPGLPPELRRAWIGVLADEQRHCRLYLDRLSALGYELAAFPLSDYFWKQAPSIARSPHGPRAFLCAMGLTFEQANLDFSLVYRDGFRAAADELSARICQRVHDDEVGHVRLAATWLRRLGDPTATEVELYSEAVPFPLSAARAKGRRFDAEARRRAGLGEEFIDHVRGARSSQQARPRGPRRRWPGS